MSDLQQLLPFKVLYNIPLLYILMPYCRGVRTVMKAEMSQCHVIVAHYKTWQLGVYI